ncbi:hypothetical protein KYI92_15090 [Pantoea allii]|uniref:Uncharacterized protein n=1 Tax=Pantoea allii TaxID=574096 RepID=A0ABS6VHS0_9GAMM|nr:hypothetical protein [Pantoea allii]MBW1215027.1 hypothetical protein [Pantoea allii]MBW1258606.1 hypothetical protein [Pantoea allii]MBW1267827.1 hypothetical protein [Pantoea allii]MBW1289698.1 hypothetical protein [Pantoea allii]
MNQTHSVPEIYNPDISYSKKCEIIGQLCRAFALHKGITLIALRDDLKNKLHVDFDNLENNTVGMLLLYEYLYSLRPAACSYNHQNQFH